MSSYYEDFSQVYAASGEGISIKTQTGQFTGYSRVLANRQLFEATRPNEQGEPCIYIGAEHEGMYDEMYRLMYPITFFLETLDVKKKVYTRNELRKILASACRLLTERAEQESIESAASDPVPSGYVNPKKMYSPVYSASLKHPDCASLLKLFNSDFDLITPDVIFSPTGLPLLKKWFDFQETFVIRPKPVLMHEMAMLKVSPESCFLNVFRRIPGVRRRNDRFIKQVLENCVGRWVHDFDFSKSSITGGVTSLILSVLLENPSFPISDIVKKYPSFSLAPHAEGELGDNAHALVPGCSVDVVVACKEDEFERICTDHFQTIKKYWSNAELEENGSSFRIASSDPYDYSKGFREVDLHRVETKYDCLYNHVPMIRAFYDGQGLHASFSCLESHLKKEMDKEDYRITFGKALPEEVLQKYTNRGFLIEGYFPEDTQQRSSWSLTPTSESESNWLSEFEKSYSRL